ncbi:LamG-like jellyroll fold domain-containing protein [Shewanella surugensis]|uniref:Winged helix-turn-helix domain-containing protein n=1 Tax=Shewanella surugensis TaxID=212020 RepID=A0ABT0L7V8_9GAMM|nr:LamG-like jellyroll fold domain-containing protein [Shewanella surugensis]MCL1123733.1 winged helix-turn-helix domain-containing protein [Shewanella surugensis]
MQQALSKGQSIDEKAIDEKNINAVRLNDLYICFKTEKVFLHQDEIILSVLSFRLLKTLLLHAPKPLSCHELLTLVWQDVITGEENVKQRISLLRKSLDQCQVTSYIQNQRNRGYFIAAPLIWITHTPSKKAVSTLSFQQYALFSLILICGFLSLAFISIHETPQVSLDVSIDNSIRLAQQQADLAFCLDGLDDYIEIEDQDRLDIHKEDFAIDTWLRTQAMEQRVIVDKRFEDQEKDVQGYVLYIDEGLLSFQLATGDGSWYCLKPHSSCSLYHSGGFVADGNWHHVAVSIDRDNPQGMSFYLDGQLISIADPTDRMASLANDNPLRIGSRSSYTTGLFKGAIGAINLYHRQLSNTEVSSLYQQGNPRRCYSIATKGGV